MIEAYCLKTVKDLREWVANKELAENWYIKIYPHNPGRIYAVDPLGNGIAFFQCKEKIVPHEKFSGRVIIDDPYKPEEVA